LPGSAERRRSRAALKAGLASRPRATTAAATFTKSSGDVRIICDFVAGMTDDFLLKTYGRLFSPRMGSVFDKL
jgi:dGTP triphosphohydrolase